MILQHALGLFTHPDDEWKNIEREHSAPITVILAYSCVLAAIGPACAYYSLTHFGWTIGDGETVMLTAKSALQLCVLTYIAALIGIFILGWIIDNIAEIYGGKHEKFAASGIALVAYSTTPAFLAGLGLLYPEPWFNLLLITAGALYACYLMLDGLPIIMHIEKDRAVFFGGAILTATLVLIVCALAGSVLIWSVGFGPEYTYG